MTSKNEARLEIKQCHCRRCGYYWFPKPETIRKYGKPKLCPICKSKYWDDDTGDNRRDRPIKKWDERE